MYKNILACYFFLEYYRESFVCVWDVAFASCSVNNVWCVAPSPF